MKRLWFAPLAVQDLRDIQDYVARDKPRAAADLVDAIEACCRRLAEFPELGALREDLDKGIREFSLENYIVFYRPVREGVEVARIVHGARRIEELFRE